MASPRRATTRSPRSYPRCAANWRRSSRLVSGYRSRVDTHMYKEAHHSGGQGNRLCRKKRSEATRLCRKKTKAWRLVHRRRHRQPAGASAAGHRASHAAPNARNNSLYSCGSPLRMYLFTWYVVAGKEQVAASVVGEDHNPRVRDDAGGSRAPAKEVSRPASSDPGSPFRGIDLCRSRSCLQ